MGKYGTAANIAAQMMEIGKFTDPREAWDAAVSQVFEGSTSSIDKVCPRNTFLSLCETGSVGPVAPGSYTRSVENKRYAVTALETMRRHPELADDQALLWKAATNGQDKQHNSQMDVICTLWRRGWIR